MGHTTAVLSIIVKSISSLAATCIRTYSVVTVLFTLILTTGTFIDIWIHCKHRTYTDIQADNRIDYTPRQLRPLL